MQTGNQHQEMRWFGLAGLLAGVVIGMSCQAGSMVTDPTKDPNNPGNPLPGTNVTPSGGNTGTTGQTPTRNDRFPAGCIANRITPTAPARCTASCEDCDCANIKYVCDKDCYASTAGCGINVNADGTATATGTEADKCDSLSCVPENDLSTELACSASQCEPPKPLAIEVNRQVQATGILFTLDTSGSMEDDLMNTACAAQSFTEAASVNGAQWTAGTMTMDMDPWTNTTTGAMTMPGLATTVGACTALTCQCPGTASGATCQFVEGGQMLSSGDPNAVTSLKERLVLGTFQQTGNEEAGLEKAMNYIVGLWQQGRKDELGMVFVVSDEEADSDGETCALQNLRAQQLPQFRAALGAAFNPPANNPGLSCQQNLTAWYIYFFKYVNVKVHALVDTTGSNEKGTIYMAVAQATGGEVANLFDCAGFRDFFTKAGTQSATLSTNICFPTAIQDPSTVTVTYTEGGQSVQVPQSATDGWQYDANLKCIVFFGSWQAKYGNYRVDY